jgi:hypothetical protein
MSEHEKSRFAIDISRIEREDIALARKYCNL